jgi:hypothetical protein
MYTNRLLQHITLETYHNPRNLRLSQSTVSPALPPQHAVLITDLVGTDRLCQLPETGIDVVGIKIVTSNCDLQYQRLD